MYVYCRLVKLGFAHNCAVIKVLFSDGYNHSNQGVKLMSTM